MTARNLPEWAEEVRATYLRGESSVFVLYGNVFDVILHQGKMMPLVDFVSDVLLSKKKILCHFNPAIGVKLRRKEERVEKIDDLLDREGAKDSVARLDQPGGLIAFFSHACSRFAVNTVKCRNQSRSSISIINLDHRHDQSTTRARDWATRASMPEMARSSYDHVNA